MEHKHDTLRHILYAAGFLFIAGFLFTRLTYLYRETGLNERMNILDYYNERDNSLDVVVLGGSGIYRFFDPMRAYETSGMTSYSYSCSAMWATEYIPAIEDIMSRQKPEVLVIDARRYLPVKTDREPGDSVRFFTDALDLGLNRFRAVTRYCRTYGLSLRESIPYYIELCLYHNNPDALLDPLHWALADNRSDHFENPKYWKGYGLAYKTTVLDPPRKNSLNTKETAPLTERGEAMYRELMEYCKGLDCEVVFLVTPYRVKKEDMTYYNEMERIAAEYDITFLNSMHDMDKMRLDFSKDFYNAHHANTWGALKFTDYFSNWLHQHYKIPSHRNDPAYSDWDDDLDAYKAAETLFLQKSSEIIAENGEEESSDD